MQPGAVLFFFFSPFSVFKNYCKSVHSFLFGTAARQWSSQADHMLFSHYGTQALVFPKQPLCAATAAKIYLQHHQLLEVSRGERKCKKKHKTRAGSVYSQRVWVSAPVFLCRPAQRTRSSPAQPPEERQFNKVLIQSTKWLIANYASSYYVCQRKAADSHNLYAAAS